MTKRTFLVAVAGLLLTRAASGQATRLIDPLDPAYRDLELLIDFGVVRQVSLGQRPLSRAAFARILSETAKTLAQRNGELASPTLGGAERDRDATRLDFLQSVVASMRERLELPDSGAIGFSLAPLRAVTLDVARTDEPTRLIPRDNGLGSIDGELNTLLANRQGRPLVYGTSALFESTHSLETRDIAISVTPQLSLIAPTDSSRRIDLRLQELQLRYLFRNLAVEVGREYLVWGQGRDVGLLNSNNSPPLDLIKLSSEEPFLFPWLLRHLGPTRLSIFYADLGADQNFPHAYAIGYRANIVPTSRLELGVSVYTKSGGRGAPPATTTARLIDLLPFLDASAYNNVFGTRGNFQFSDHYAGFDGRLRVPSLGTNVFWEVLLNDFDVRRLKSVFWEDAGHVFGVDFPRLSQSGRLRTSLEYHHTGIRYYEHEQFTSGQTVHHTLTGDPLGPNGQGIYANVDWYASVQRRLGVQFALERRSNDQYAFVPEPHFGFTRIAERPKEWRGRILTSWQALPEREHFGALLQFGYERMRNFDFLSGHDRHGAMGRIAIQYRFR